MDLFAPKHLLLILLIMLVVFGGKRLKNLGSDLGSSLRGFRKAMSEDEAEKPTKETQARSGRDPRIVASNHSEDSGEQGTVPTGAAPSTKELRVLTGN